MTLGRSACLFSAVPLFGLATGALFPLVALGLEEGDAPAGFIGTVTSLYYAGSFLGAMSFGAVVRRLGYRAGFAIAALAAAAAAHGLTVTEDWTAWLWLRFGGGYALGAYYVVVDSWVLALGRRETRGKLFAVYETIRLAATAGLFAYNLGALSGPALAGSTMESLGPTGLYQFLGACAIVAAVAAVLDHLLSACCPERASKT